MLRKHQSKRIELFLDRLVELRLGGILRLHADHYLFNVVSGSFDSLRCDHRSHSPTSLGKAVANSRHRRFRPRLAVTAIYMVWAATGCSMRDDIVVGRDPLVGIHPKAAGFKYARGAHPSPSKIGPARL